jgi:hypothetical protein
MRKSTIVILGAAVLAAVAGIVRAQNPQGGYNVIPGVILVRDGNGNLQKFNSYVFGTNPSIGNNAQRIVSMPVNGQTTGQSAIITTGGTFQTLLSTQPAGTIRNSISAQNNQISGTDVCYVLYGDANIKSQVTPGTTTTSSNLTINGNSVPAGNAAIILNPGQMWTRQYPINPGDEVFVTCVSTGDSLYVDTQ